MNLGTGEKRLESLVMTALPVVHPGNPMTYKFGASPDGWFMLNGIRREVRDGMLVPLSENQWNQVVMDMREFYEQKKGDKC